MSPTQNGVQFKTFQKLDSSPGTSDLNSHSLFGAEDANVVIQKLKSRSVSRNNSPGKIIKDIFGHDYQKIQSSQTFSRHIKSLNKSKNNLLMKFSSKPSRNLQETKNFVSRVIHRKTLTLKNSDMSSPLHPSNTPGKHRAFDHEQVMSNVHSPPKIIFRQENQSRAKHSDPMNARRVSDKIDFNNSSQGTFELFNSVQNTSKKFQDGQISSEQSDPIQGTNSQPKSETDF